MLIRDAREDDLAAVVALECESFCDPWAISSFRAELTRQGGIFQVAEDDGAVVAYLVAWDMLDYLYLANIAVVPSHRRKGLARLMLKKIVGFCKDNQRPMIVLDVRVSNRAARTLYESMGFVVIRHNPSYYGDEDGITLILPIQAQEPTGKSG